MKLNFWQWLGIILVLLGGAFWLWEQNQTSDLQPRDKAAPPAKVPTSAPAPTTQP